MPGALDLDFMRVKKRKIRSVPGSPKNLSPTKTAPAAVGSTGGKTGKSGGAFAKYRRKKSAESAVKHRIEVADTTPAGSARNARALSTPSTPLSGSRLDLSRLLTGRRNSSQNLGNNNNNNNNNSSMVVSDSEDTVAICNNKGCSHQLSRSNEDLLNVSQQHVHYQKEKEPKRKSICTSTIGRCTGSNNNNHNNSNCSVSVILNDQELLLVSCFPYKCHFLGMDGIFIDKNMCILRATVSIFRFFS